MFTTPYTDDEFDCHWHCSCVFSLFVLTEFCFFILGSDRLPEAAEQSEPKLRYRLLERCNHLSEEVSYLYFCSWRHLKLTLPVDGILLIPDSFLFFCIWLDWFCTELLLQRYLQGTKSLVFQGEGGACVVTAWFFYVDTGTHTFCKHCTASVEPTVLNPLVQQSGVMMQKDACLWVKGCISYTIVCVKFWSQNLLSFDTLSIFVVHNYQHRPGVFIKDQSERHFVVVVIVDLSAGGNSFWMKPAWPNL